MKIKKYILTFSLFLAFYTLVYAQNIQTDKSNILTLQDCIDITLKNNPSIASSYASQEAQKNRVSQSKSSYLPQVDASANYSRGNSKTSTGWNEAANNYSSSINAKQLIYDFGQTGLSTDIQKNTYYSSVADTKNLVVNTIYQLKEAYYAVLLAKQRKLVYEQSVEQYQQQLKRAKGYYEVGTRPKIDVTTAEVNLNNAKLNLIQTENLLNKSFHVLLNIMGIYDYDESFDITMNDTLPEFTLTEEEAINTAMQNRQDLLSYRLKLENARQNIKLSKTGYAPSINATGSYGWSGNDFPLYNRWSVGAGISVPLFSGFSTYNKVKEAQNNMLSAYYNLTAAEQDILLDIKKAYLNVQDSKSKIPVAEISRTQAEENYQLAVGRYKVGVGNYIEVKDAETTLSDAKLSYINAVFDYILSIAALNKAMGIE